jgi:hypothetical protein
VRLWHTKETHQAVAEKLIDVAPEAGDGGGSGLLVLGRDAVPLFGIELRRDLG